MDGGYVVRNTSLFKMIPKQQFIDIQLLFSMCAGLVDLFILSLQIDKIRERPDIIIVSVVGGGGLTSKFVRSTYNIFIAIEKVISIYLEPTH